MTQLLITGIYASKEYYMCISLFLFTLSDKPIQLIFGQFYKSYWSGLTFATNVLDMKVILKLNSDGLFSFILILFLY